MRRGLGPSVYHDCNLSSWEVGDYEFKASLDSTVSLRWASSPTKEQTDVGSVKGRRSKEGIPFFFIII